MEMDLEKFYINTISGLQEVELFANIKYVFSHEHLFSNF